MEAFFSDRRPVLELDPVLECGRGPGHQRGFVDTDEAGEVPDRRNGRFAHTDPADGFRLDDRDPEAAIARAVEGPVEIGGAHPAGAAAAENDQMFGKGGGTHDKFPVTGA